MTTPFLTLEDVEQAGGRICTSCGEWKSLDELYGPCRSRPRYSSECKVCARRRVRASQIRHNERGPSPDYRRTTAHPKQTKYQAQRYGMTEQELLDLRALLNNCCAVCETPRPPRSELHVDHDHDCCPGATSCGLCWRGLLCHSCNQLASKCGDDGDIAQRRGYVRLAVYLHNGGIPASANYRRIRLFQIPTNGGVVTLRPT